MRKTGLKQISLTTNAITLHKNLEIYKQNGLDSVNISIDSLSSLLFSQITRRNGLPLVLKSIQKCVEMDFPTKLNVVVTPMNFKFLPEFIAFVKDKPISVRFIEYMVH